MLITELYTDRIPALYLEFSEAIGDKHWKQRVRLCEDEIRGNPLLDDILQDENRIAFQLAQMSKLIGQYSGAFLPPSVIRELYPAATFMAQTLSLGETLGSAQRARFYRRIHGAFKNPDDMRGLHLELSAATHFTRAGLSVEWPEAADDRGFDLLVNFNNAKKFEVECKSISTDKGRKIHQREARDFFRLIDQALKRSKFELAGGISMVLTVEDRLPNAYKERVELALAISNAIVSLNSTEFSETAKITTKQFDTASLQHIRSSGAAETRQLIENITESPNCNSLVRQNQAGNILILTVKSSRDDSFVDAVFDTMKVAAERQFTKQRAGILMVELFGIDDSQMRELANLEKMDTPSNLQIRTSRFLDSSSRQHIAQVYFSSRQSFRQRSDSTFTSNATTYFFENTKSTFWNNDLSLLFGSASEELK